jgi:hypothetical protein
VSRFDPNYTGIVFDGFAKGMHSAVYNKKKWVFDTPGEALIEVFFKYKPSKDLSKMEGLQSKLLPFEVYRKSVDSEWTKISGEVYDTVYTDTSVMYNKEYSYKINCKYVNPPDSVFSREKTISLDK